MIRPGLVVLMVVLLGSLAGSCSNPEYDNNHTTIATNPAEPKAADKKDYLITEISVGRAMIGMTLSELKLAYPECASEEVDVEEFGIDGKNKGVLLRKAGEPFIFAWTNEGEEQIKGLVALAAELTTEQGYRVGMTSGEIVGKCPGCYIAPDMLDPRIEYVTLGNTEIRLEFLTTDSTRIGRYKYHHHEPKSKLLVPDRRVDRISIIAGQDQQ